MDYHNDNNDAEKRRQKRLKLHATYREILTTPQGQTMMKDLFKFCRMGSTTFVPGDPCLSAFNEGMRRVFLRLWSLGKCSINELEDMAKE